MNTKLLQTYLRTRSMPDRDALVESLCRDIKTIVRSAVSSDVWRALIHRRNDPDIIYASARLGVLKAVETYDSRKALFPVWVRKCVWLAIIDQFRTDMVVARSLRGAGIVVERAPLPSDRVTEDGHAEIEAKITITELLDRTDPRTADIVRRVYFDYETIKAVGVSYGLSEGRISQIITRWKSWAREELEN